MAKFEVTIYGLKGREPEEDFPADALELKPDGTIVIALNGEAQSFAHGTWASFDVFYEDRIMRA